MKPDFHDDRHLTRREAAEWSGLNHRLFEVLAVKGGGPIMTKIGRSVYYRVGDLREWIEAHRVKSTSDEVKP